MLRDASWLNELRRSEFYGATFGSKHGIIAVRLIVAVPLPRALPPEKQVVAKR